MTAFELNDVECRVLGALMEKSMTTPEYYPLSLNGLANACNQKSNRNPVLSLDESVVVRGLDELKEKRLVVQSDASRVPKYEELLVKSKNLVAREAAIICLLLLRGPQTSGELRGRSERMHKFETLEEVNETLDALADLGMVVKLPRQPGRKEARFCHLLAGDPDLEAFESAAAPEQATIQVRAENERIKKLEEEVEELKDEMARLAGAFSDFKAQFE
ncbi:MAG: YceH family protein [Proteobacteria bacterium]|nr:YceH family protein [Pseudomonadota bacterium]MBU1736667.1 YceH family protein [Pseudomonadota bacterium]